MKTVLCKFFKNQLIQINQPALASNTFLNIDQRNYSKDLKLVLK